MSQQLTLELSDEAYASLEKKANAVGLQVSEWIITLLNQQNSIDNSNVAQENTTRSETAISETAVSETVLLSEQALSVDWNRPEEDIAWSHLQLGQEPVER